MIIVTWRMSTAPDKVWEGLEWAKKVNTISNKWGSALKVWLLRSRTGTFNSFTMAAQFASMAEYEASSEKRSTDSGFKALAKERQESDWFVDVETTINEVIEES